MMVDSVGKENKYTVSFAMGTTNFILVISMSMGRCSPREVMMLSKDDYTIRESHPVDGFLFIIEYLLFIMGSEHIFPCLIPLI